MATEAPPAAASGNNASEFVRKLFKMLEDPSHQDVARWGKGGDTFVVVEGEKFTRSILPKHFKHSNMSSFIRQLNKYDFHKVKPSADMDGTASGNILEFKHPYFRVDSKDDLDNIRRKAPAPRKAQPAEDFTTTQHVGVISEQLTATQQQVQQLQELFAEVSQTNRLLVNEVLTLQKMLNAQKQAQHEMLNYLSVYNGRRSNAMMGQPMNSNGTVAGADSDESVPELRRARELLSSVAPDAIADRELERLHGVYGPMTDASALVTPVTMPLLHDPITDIARYPVYPVGQTVGIDPFSSDHIHKIPFAMPSEASSMTDAATSQPPAAAAAGQGAGMSSAALPVAPPTSAASARDKLKSLWGPKKPHVFLVEDDPTCAKIGIKFLKSMGCEVEHAENGADAFNRVTAVGNEFFDLIFMDIIMPRLDGVSATMYIRQQNSATPVVAMTSNIRPDEVNGYFEHGMNGVLAKPFTKEGMLKSLKTHLVHLLKDPPEHDPTGGSPFILGNMAFLNPAAMNASAAGIKMEGPGTPTAGGSTWSPSNLTHDVDSYGMANGANQYAMNAARQPYGAVDNDSPPGKRQRNY